MSEFIGRRVAVGFGIESTPGTAVAPSMWVRQLSLDVQRMSTSIQNESAMGRVEKVNDSAITEQWAEGKLEGKVNDLSIGYPLYNIFGSKVTTTNADSSTTVKDHTFDVVQSQVAPTLTLARKDPNTDRRHALCTFDDIEFSADAGDWVKYSATLKARQGATASDTVAYVAENEFTSKNITVKLAANVAGLGAAAAIPAKSFKLKIDRKSTAYFPFGATDPLAFNTGAWEATGEIVLRYSDTTYEDLWFANTAQALSIALVNSDVTIGTSAHPSLTFTAPQARLNSFSLSNDLDNVVEQTIGFYCELSTTAAYALRAVLTNTQTAYV